MDIFFNFNSGIIFYIGSFIAGIGGLLFLFIILLKDKQLSGALSFAVGGPIFFFLALGLLVLVSSQLTIVSNIILFLLIIIMYRKKMNKTYSRQVLEQEGRDYNEELKDTARSKEYKLLRDNLTKLRDTTNEKLSTKADNKIQHNYETVYCKIISIVAEDSIKESIALLDLSISEQYTNITKRDIVCEAVKTDLPSAIELFYTMNDKYQINLAYTYIAKAFLDNKDHILLFKFISEMLSKKIIPASTYKAYLFYLIDNKKDLDYEQEIEKVFASIEKIDNRSILEEAMTSYNKIPSDLYLRLVSLVDKRAYYSSDYHIEKSIPFYMENESGYESKLMKIYEEKSWSIQS